MPRLAEGLRDRLAHSDELSPEERDLLAATVGNAHYRVLTRRPLTVALGP